MSKERMREYQRARRGKAVKPDDVKPVDVKLRAVKPDTNVKLDVNLPEGWGHVAAHIRVPGNLAKMQAICGSLGKYADMVRFGVHGPTCEEIGKVIGIRGPLVHDDR